MTKFKIKSIITWDTLLIIVAFYCAFVVPVLPPSWGVTPMQIGFSLIFVSGIMTMEKRKMIILYLALAAFVLQWVSHGLDWGFVADISKALDILFFLIVIFSLIREMAGARVVTTRVIMASISGYLLLGLIFSVVVLAIAQRDPGAFNFAGAGNTAGDPVFNLSESLYFGFVTLATLGYGDILPLKPYTRSLSTLITITGQLYVATIIGILIGKFASASNDGHVKDSGA